MSGEDESHDRIPAWWLRTTADRGVRAHTDAWRRLAGHRVLHAARGIDMTTIVHRVVGIPGITIRRSTAEDWGDVAAFLDRCREASRHSTLAPVNPTPSVEIPAARGSGSGTLVAEWDGAISGGPTIVGLVAWRALGPRDPDRADIVLVTANGWAARGVGSALVAAAARDARHHHITAFLIPVIPRNGALRAAANRAGFTERRRTTRTRDMVEIPLVAAPARTPAAAPPHGA